MDTAIQTISQRRAEVAAPEPIEREGIERRVEPMFEHTLGSESDGRRHHETVAAETGCDR